MLWRSILVWDYMTGPQTMLTVITILVLTRPRNWSTCSVSHIIKTTLAKNTSVKWLKFSCVVPAFPLGSYHSQLWAGSGQGRKIPHDWWDSNPRLSDPQSDALTTALWGLMLIVLNLIQQRERDCCDPVWVLFSVWKIPFAMQNGLFLCLEIVKVILFHGYGSSVR